MKHKVRMEEYEAQYVIDDTPQGKVARYRILNRDTGEFFGTWKRAKLWTKAEGVAPSRQWIGEARDRAKSRMAFILETFEKKDRKVKAEKTGIREPVTTIEEFIERAKLDPGNRGTELSPCSVKARNRNLDNFLKWLLKYTKITLKSRVTEITKGVINRYVEELARGGLTHLTKPTKPNSRSSIARQICSICRAFTWMITNDDIVGVSRNPASIGAIHSESFTDVQNRLKDRSWDWSVMETLLSQCTDKLLLTEYTNKKYQHRPPRPASATEGDRTPIFMKPALMILKYTGMRPGELANAEWSGIDWKKRVLVTSGKQGSRVVPLVKEITRYLKWWQSELKSVGLSPETLICLPDGGKVSSPALQKAFKRFRERCGVDSKYSLYGLRHAFAHHLANSGVHISKIKSLMGHKKIDTTMRYLHQDTEDLVHEIDDLFSGGEAA